MSLASPFAFHRYGVVYFIFVLLGTGTLLPWNVFLTEKVGPARSREGCKLGYPGKRTARLDAWSRDVC